MSKRTKITHNQRISYCKKENRFQRKVYGPKVQSGKMTPHLANRQMQIILELKELAELLERKGINWYKLLDQLEELPSNGVMTQQNLFQ